MGVASWGRRRSEGKLASLGGGAIGGGGGGGAVSIAEFKFLVGNSVSSPAIGGAGTYSRAGVAYQIDVNGNWVSASSGTIRDSHYVNGTRTILLEPAITNTCTDSDNLSAWTAVNAPTLTSGQGDVYGTTIGYNVQATSGVSVQGVVITLAAISGNTVHGLTVCAKKGASPPASGSLITYRDTTAPADRLKATLTWSGAAPSIAMTTGKYLGALPNANGWYTLFFQTTAVTAANTHTLELDANGTAADTGDVYFGGVTAPQATNSGGSSVVPTAGSTVNRVTDSLSFPHGGLVPGLRTLYAKIVSIGEFGYANVGVFSIGNTTDGQHLRNGNGNVPLTGETTILNNAGAASNGIPALGWVMGDTVEIRGASDAGPKMTGGVVVNGGGETTGAGANTSAYGGAYGTVNFQVGNSSAGVVSTPIAIVALKSAPGTQSMASMQAA